MGSGIDAPCGCRKFVLCPFPTTTWYYATLCRHDNDSAPRALTPTMERVYWWYDLNRQRMISAVAFEHLYKCALTRQNSGHLSAPTPGGIHLLHSRARGQLFVIGSGGQVRRLFPKSGDWV